MDHNGWLRVWTLCEHGSRMRHWWFESEDDEDDETYVSCPGGREIVLRQWGPLWEIVEQ